LRHILTFAHAEKHSYRNETTIIMDFWKGQRIYSSAVERRRTDREKLES
jgi:hypothetical protein